MKTLHNFRRFLLFILLLGVSSTSIRAQYCTIDFSSGTEPISLVDFGGMNNASSNTTGPAYEDYTAMTATVLQGQPYTITVQGNTFGNYSDYIRVYIDWNQNNDLTDAGEAFDVGIITNSTGLDAIVATTSIPVPITAVQGNTRMRVTKKWNSYAASCNTTGYGQAEDYTVNVLAANSCVGMPVAGTAAAPSTVCPNTAFNLSVTGYTVGSGITFQWEYNDGGGWLPLAGATSASYNVSSGISIATDYRVVVTCVNGGFTDISNTVSVAVNLPTQCYCTVSYPLSGGGPISLVDFAGITNATSAATGAPSYEDFTAMSAVVMQNASYPITVKGNTVGNYSDYVRVFIDWDQNGLFTDPGESYDIGILTNTTGLDAINVTANIAVPATAALGNTRMRVTKKWNAYSTPCNSTGYGQAEDYTLTILAANTCVGTPMAGTASAPATVCPNTAFNLSLTGYTVSAGISIQWEFYNTATTSWDPIAGATTPGYTATGITSPTDYRAVVTCSNGGSTDISNIVSVGISPFLSCYCIPTSAGGATITNINIAATTLNNTSGAAPGPNYYISYPATGNTTATLMEGVSYTINGTFSTAAIASLWIDFNQDGIYDASEWTQITTNATAASASFTVPLGALTGQTGMRVRSRGGNLQNGATDACTPMGGGETEDYIVSIIPAVACSGTPTPGTASAPASVCANTSFDLSLTGTSLATGINIQWEAYDAGLNAWAPLPGATGASYTISGGIQSPASYRAVVTCANSAMSDISNTVAIAINPATQCYCTVTFPGGVEPITLVDFAGISNATSNVAGGTPDLEDFTMLTGSVTQGQTYPIVVKGNTIGSYTDFIRLFIDWNQNGSFLDAGESFDIGTIFNSTGLDATQATANIIVPTGIPAGTTRMRVTKKWSAYATSCNNAGYGQAEDYSLMVDWPLAISLQDITAVNAGNKNRIGWKTAGEHAGDRFELERSADGANFSRIAAMDAKGEASTYSYWDLSPFSGINHYRLKMIDAGGKTAYSKTVTATVTGNLPFAVAVYPNPAKDRTQLALSAAPGEKAYAVVTDLTGKTIAELHITALTTDIDLRNIAPGIYLLRYTDGEHTSTIKIHKQ